MSRDEAQLWDGRADAWNKVCATPAFLRFRDALFGYGLRGERGVALDLGCGTGLIALPAAELFSKVIAVDISQRMLEHLSVRAAEARLTNVEPLRADMRCLPLADRSVDVVFSCYAFHHLSDDGKELAMAEVKRVLRPGGRVAVADMMFSLSLERRDRRVIASKVLSLTRKGPRGLWRLAHNAGRIVTRRWEQPASLEWWSTMLERRGFEEIAVHAMVSEAGCAFARRPVKAEP